MQLERLLHVTVTMSDLHVNGYVFFRADDIASDFMLAGVQGVQCIHGDRSVDMRKLCELYMKHRMP